MQRKIAVDSGPLIALFDKDDAYYDRALAFIKNVKSELMTTAAVITEVVYVLDFSVRAQAGFLRWIGSGAVTVDSPPAEDFPRIAALMEKYHDLPMDYADASLVALCDRLHVDDIASIDSDFSIYRLKGNRRFRNRF